MKKVKRTEIGVENAPSTLHLYTPYNPDFIFRIKELGGKWNGKAWVIPKNKEVFTAARAIMKEIYGYLEYSIHERKED